MSLIRVEYQNGEVSEFEFTERECSAIDWVYNKAKELTPTRLNDSQFELLEYLIPIINHKYFQSEFWFILNKKDKKLYKIRKHEAT